MLTIQIMLYTVTHQVYIPKMLTESQLFQLLKFVYCFLVFARNGLGHLCEANALHILWTQTGRTRWAMCPLAAASMALVQRHKTALAWPGAHRCSAYT